MKFLFDMLPVIVFFIGYSSGQSLPSLSLAKPIELATALAIAVSVLQIAWLLLRRKKVEPLQWISLALITVLGGATILLHNATFIFWKPSALYWCMGSGLLIARYFSGKQPLKSVMGKEMELPGAVWDKLNWAWAIFFLLMGIVNLLVAYNFPEAVWVKFKLFGTLGFTLLFAVAQALWLARQLPATPDAAPSASGES